MKELEKVKEALEEIVEYLDSNKLNQVGSDSILHKNAKAALNEYMSEEEKTFRCYVGKDVLPVMEKPKKQTFAEWNRDFTFLGRKRPGHLSCAEIYLAERVVDYMQYFGEKNECL